MFYTANLAAFLTVKRMDVPIKSADDLAAVSYFLTPNPVNTQRGGGPILDQAPSNFYGAKPSGQISSKQNRYCLLIHSYVLYFFLALDKIKSKAEKKWVLKCRVSYF